MTGLELGGEFERVARDHTVVRVGRGHQRGRVGRARFQVVVGGVALEVFEHLGAVLGRAIVIGPESAGREFVKTQHVHHTHGRDGCAKEVRSLGHAGPDQQTAVGAAQDGEFFRLGMLLVDQILGRCHEVVEHVLFVLLLAGFVPSLAVFAAPTEIGHGIHAAHLHPGQTRD